MLEGEPPYWRILGRTSVDIIKSGGYKISALGIENVLLAIEGIRECAVLGLPHPVMGELVAAVVAFKDEPVCDPYNPGGVVSHQITASFRGSETR